MPCAGCVDDATVADRTLRVPFACFINTAAATGRFGPLGFFLINAGELVTCTAAIPSDFSSGAGGSIAVAFRQPSGIGENETISMQLRPLTNGLAVPAGTTRTVTLANNATVHEWLETFTEAEIFGPANSRLIHLTVSSGASSRGFEILGVSLVYSARR